MRKRLSFLFASFLSAVVVCSMPQMSMAQPLKRDRVDVFQLKSITKKRRHELTPQFSVSLNDSFVQTLMVGGSYNFHITEAFGFEVNGGYAFTFDSAAVNDLRGGNRFLTKNGEQFNNSQPSIIVKPQVSKLVGLVLGHFVWSPLVGKFSVGQAIFDFDIFLIGGAGAIFTNRGAVLPAASFGFGFRVFLAKWFTMRLDIKDAIFGQNFTVGSGNEVATLTHNLFFSIGFGFVLPTEPVYTFEQEP